MMSGGNEGEENKQKDDFSASEEFEFYFPFIKPLVLDLPTEEDRVIASAWVQKLEAEPETDEEKKQRLNYLKLLLFVLQRGRLSGIFKKQPPSGSLQPFPQGFSIFDMGNWMLEQDDSLACGGGDAGRLPYTIEISNDLREFVASQEIPNFGVQIYYAWSSDEPINKWSFFDEEKFPQYILDKIKLLQESKSDEKSLISRNGCMVKKKGCSLTLSEKYSGKKVRSPQEIERSQGRSFHTYMGLVRQMGNFSDKCDDDPEKFQRQNQRKGKCVKRSNQKRCPGSEGEAEDLLSEEEFDNLATNLGGLNAQNRPCLCPYPCYHSVCPDHHTKGGPQPYEDQQTLNKTPGYNVRSGPENTHWTATVTKSTAPRHMTEQCLEGEMSMAMSSQKRSASPRPRSSSPNRRNLECPPEDNSGELSNRGGVCICSSPPCNCPCPRTSPKMSAYKTPPANLAGGRVCTDPSRTFIKSPKQDICFNENRGIGSYRTSFNAPDTCSPTPRRPDVSPVGGRTGASSGIRPTQTEIIHCYDNQNPDPGLIKDSNWIQTMGGGNKYMNTDLKIACRRDQLIAAAQQNKCKMTSRRELFSEQSSTFPTPAVSCQQSPVVPRMSPPLESHPLCNHSPPEEISAPCPSLPSGQGVYSHQNYLECEGSASLQMHRGFYETCGRQKTDTYKKPGPQTKTRFKNAPTYYTSSHLAGRNDSERLANMTNVLQGIRQKTEAHREKCTQMRSPVRDMRPESGMYHSPQTPEISICSPGPLDRAYIGFPGSPQQYRFPDSPYPGFFPGRIPYYNQNECDADYDEDECDSSESLETCPQEGLSKDDSDCFQKTLTPRNYGVTFTEADQNCESKYISSESCPSEQSKVMTQGSFPNNFMEANDPNYGLRSSGRTYHHTRMNVPPRDCGHRRTSPGRIVQKEPCLNAPPRESKIASRGNSGRTSRTQRAGSGRTSPNETCTDEVPPECYNSYQDDDMQNCDTQTFSTSTVGNRYFNLSPEQSYQPVTSTPLEHYKRNFKDQGTDELSAIRLPSSRCT